MSSARALSDDEVAAEMTKMVAFIRQEAQEKAREIRIKADEEFAVEKARMVRLEMVHVKALYAKKKKAVTVGSKVSQSSQTNGSRLKILTARDSHFSSLFTTASEKLSDRSRPEYLELLNNLVLQSFLQLMEPRVTIQVRDEDLNDARKIINDTASKDYKQITGLDVQFEVIGNLPESSFGGLIASTMGGKIKINNTLSERLSLLEDQMLPEIRMDLFGANPNRRFFS